MNTQSVIKKLSSGAFICSQTEPQMLKLLQQDAIVEELNRVFNPFRRTVLNIDNTVFYLGYQKSLENDEINELKRQFEQVRDHIHPSIEFLSLLMAAENRDATPQPGDVISLPRVADIINNNPTLETSLKSLTARNNIFHLRKSTPDNIERLKKIFEELTKLDYLTLSNQSSGLYTITGKLNHLYLIIEFICENELAEDMEDANKSANHQQGLI